MAKDAFGNYVAGLNSVLINNSQPSVGMVVGGAGAPTSAPLSWQFVYVDSVGGTVYVNQGGAWVAFSGSSGAAGYTGHYAGSSPGVTPAAAPSFAVDLDTGYLWVYYASAWHFTGVQMS